MATMRPLPIAEALALLDKFSPKYAALAALGITTGARISELLTLRRCDLILNGEIKDKISIVKLKTGCGRALTAAAEPSKRRVTRRLLVIPKEIHPYLVAHLYAEARRGYVKPDDFVFRGRNGQAMQRQAAGQYFKQFLGLKHGTHWMRKTFAGRMIDTFKEEHKGDTIQAARAVQRLLGHRQLETTLRYLQFDNERSDEIVRDAWSRAFSPKS